MALLLRVASIMVIFYFILGLLGGVVNHIVRSAFSLSDSENDAVRVGSADLHLTAVYTATIGDGCRTTTHWCTRAAGLPSY
jgi:hypothetical protein